MKPDADLLDPRTTPNQLENDLLTSKALASKTNETRSDIQVRLYRNQSYQVMERGFTDITPELGLNLISEGHTSYRGTHGLRFSSVRVSLLGLSQIWLSKDRRAMALRMRGWTRKRFEDYNRKSVNCPLK